MVKETGQEALDYGKQVAQDLAQSAQETVKESGQQLLSPGTRPSSP
jgi:hypothetical protein